MEPQYPSRIMHNYQSDNSQAKILNVDALQKDLANIPLPQQLPTRHLDA